jgi:hypothetical protein
VAIQISIAMIAASAVPVDISHPSSGNGTPTTFNSPLM